MPAIDAMSADAETEAVSSTEHFARAGYALLDHAIGSGDARRYSDYALMNRQHAGYYAAEPEHASMSRYGDVLGESLLLNLRPALETATGLELLPCYSVLSIHANGASQAPRLEPAAREITALLVLDTQGASTWPVLFNANGEQNSLSPQVGQLLVYRANQVECAREKFDGETWVQLILQYVTADGEHAHYRYDGRRGPGVPLDRGQQDEVIRKRKEFDAALAAGDDRQCFCSSGQPYSVCHGLKQRPLTA